MNSRVSSQRHPWRAARGAAIGLVGLITALLTPALAFAHAELVSSKPGNGEQVLTPPAAVEIKYSEGVQLGEAKVVDASGRRVDRGDLTVDPSDHTLITVPLQDMGEGIYTLNWQMLAEDGHTTKGSFFFVVGPEMPTRAQFIALLTQGDAGGGQVNPVEPPLRGLIFLALSVLAGLPLMLLLMLGRGLPDGDALGAAAWRRVRTLLVAGALVLGGAAVLLALGQMAMASTTPGVDAAVAFLTTTGSGRVALVRLGLSVALVAVLVGVRQRWAWLLGAALVALAAEGSVTWSSHSTTLIGGVGPSLADYGHLLGGAVWAGGLVVLALVLPTALASQEQPARARALAAEAIGRFSMLAVAAVALAVATGLVLASFHVPTLRTLVATLYGSSLAVKLALLLAALALGAWHKLVVLRRLAAAEQAPAAAGQREIQRFVRSVRVELVLVVGILFASGLLTSAPTASTALAQQEAHTPRTLVDRVRDLDVALTTTPYQVGLNVFDVVFSRNGVPIQDVRDANLLMRQPDADVYLPQAHLDAVQPGLYSTLGSFPLPGKWQVRASGFVEGRFTAYTFETTVLAPAPDQRAATADPLFQGALRLAALLVALAGALAVAWELYTRRRGSQDAAPVRRVAL
ncbi:MAG TPA: copper resistance protein CopC [Chloroflexota bacterium]|jgi:copper transport protein